MIYRLLPRAVRDLEAIRTYIASEDPSAGARVARTFIDTFELLAHQPMIGREVEGRTTREWSVSGMPYLIPYRIKGDCIEILRVFHTRRDRPKDWR